MWVELKFGIFQRVKIVELDILEIVSEISISKKGIQYKVRYFFNSALNEVYFIEEELALTERSF